MKFIIASLTLICAALPGSVSALTLGVGTSFPTLVAGFGVPLPGLSHPYGLLYGSLGAQSSMGDLTAYVGKSSPSQNHISYTIKPVSSLRLGSRWTPVLGISADHDSRYQRMTTESREPDPSTHLETYLVADWLLHFKGILGLRFGDMVNDRRCEIEFGFVRILKTIAKNSRREEIRNCYVDACPDGQHRSGGGQWPTATNALYINLAYTLDLSSTEQQ